MYRKDTLEHSYEEMFVHGPPKPQSTISKADQWENVRLRCIYAKRNDKMSMCMEDRNYP